MVTLFSLVNDAETDKQPLQMKSLHYYKELDWVIKFSFWMRTEIKKDLCLILGVWIKSSNVGTKWKKKRKRNGERRRENKGKKKDGKRKRRRRVSVHPHWKVTGEVHRTGDQREGKWDLQHLDRLIAGPRLWQVFLRIQESEKFPGDGNSSFIHSLNGLFCYPLVNVSYSNNLVIIWLHGLYLEFGVRRVQKEDETCKRVQREEMPATALFCFGLHTTKNT